jgi:predicted patatin/cPLA2 family phospholipase
MDYLYHEVFRNIYPLNNINETSIRFFITVTDCETGRPYYVENKPGTDILGALFAGAAMPFGYPLPVKYGERLSADGGITDSVPFQKALDHGASDLWIILTRPKGYRKSSSRLANYLNRWMFRKYPALVQAMARRSEMYNDQLATIEGMEKTGKAIVIRPSPELKLSRLQRNQTKLHQAIDQGYQDAMLVLKETGLARE